MELEGGSFMRLFMEDEGKLYELVKSTNGCEECEWNPSKNSDDCGKLLSCRAASKILFGSYKLRHWKEVFS